MRFAYQTIIWGSKLPLQDALTAVRECGFQGVELAQGVQGLIEEGIVNSALHLSEILAQQQLRLIGLAGDSLRDRMAQVRPGPSSPYLYADVWDADAELALKDGYNLAVHVHAFMPLRSTRQVFQLLERHSSANLKWIPDTGHLTVLNENIQEVLQHFRDRIAAVHLKDWTPIYGRSAHRYARGFADLGTGVVDIRGVLTSLRNQHFLGWVAVEQDYCNDDPFDALDRSARFLHDLGFLQRRVSRTVPALPEATLGLSTDQDSLVFKDGLTRASRKPTDVAFSDIAAIIRASFNCEVVSLWACSPSHDLLTLIAVSPSLPISIQSLHTPDCLCGLAIGRHSPTEFDLTSPEPGRPYSRPDLRFVEDPAMTPLNLTNMISVPVFSPYNRHYVRMIVNLFTRSEPSQWHRDRIGLIGEALAPIIDSILDRECADAAAHASYLAGVYTSLATFPNEIAKLIRSKTQCEGVTVFWRNDSHDAIIDLGTTGIDWLAEDGDRFYRRGEGITGAVWERGQSKVSRNALAEEGRVGKSAERIGGAPHSCLWEPIFSKTSDIVGVIRCQNKKVPSLGAYNMFSDHDSAVIEAAMTVAAPHIELLLADERRRKATARMAHELLSPTAAIKAAVQLMRAETEVDGRRLRFAFDYIGDVDSWANLMAFLVENAAVFGGMGQRGSLPMIPAPTRLMAEVVAPAVRQVDILLRRRSFPRRGISYGRFDGVPPLLIDRGRFQQVIFNLLSNAIKFAFNDPSAFSVFIDGHPAGDGFRLICQDRGSGIPPSLASKVFLEGFRAPRSPSAPVTGQGLGLWIVKEIVEAHGGRVDVTHNSQPTEISIWLPNSLQTTPRAR